MSGARSKTHASTQTRSRRNFALCANRRVTTKAGAVSLNIRPVTQQFSINDLHSERGEFAQTFLSTTGINLLINHNMYVAHKTAHDACHIVFKEADTSRIPNEVEKNLQLIDAYLN